MHEGFVSRASLLAWALWVVAAGMLGAGWAVLGFAPGSWHLAAMLGATACAVASVAATATIRVFQMRTCALIRAQSEADREVAQIRAAH